MGNPEYGRIPSLGKNQGKRYTSVSIQDETLNMQGRKAKLYGF